MGAFLFTWMAVLACQVDGGVPPDAGVVPSSAWLRGPSARREPLPSDPPVGPDRRFLEAAATDGGVVTPNPVHPYAEGWVEMFSADAGTARTEVAGTPAGEPVIPFALPLGPEQAVVDVPRSTTLVDGRAMDVTRSGRSVHALDAQEMRHRGINDMAAAQLLLPGTWPVQQMVAGAGPGMRGFRGSRVLVTLDGMRMNTAAWGDGFVPWLATVDPHALEEVAVLNGPASTLGGSDAMGGVLALKGRGADHRDEVTVHAEGSAYAESATAARGVRLRAEGGLGPLSASLYGRISDTHDTRGGRSQGALGETRHGNMNLAARTAVRLWGQEFSAGYDMGRVTGAPLTGFCRRRDNSPTFDCRILDDLQRDSFHAGLKLHPGAFMDGVELRVGYQRQASTLARVHFAGGVIDRAHDQVHAFTGVARAATRRWVVRAVSMQASAGMEVGHDMVEARFNRSSMRPDIGQVRGEEIPTLSILPNGAWASQASIHAQVEWALWQVLALRAGMRGALHRVVVPDTSRDPGGKDRFFPAATGFGQVLFTPFSRLVLGAGVHHGYHAPNIMDVAGRHHATLGYEVPRNTDRVEQALTAETSAAVSAWRVDVRGSLFATRWMGAADRVRGTFNGLATAGGAPVWERVRGEDVVMLGAELDARARPWRHATISGQATWVQAERMGRRREALSGSPPPRALLMAGWMPPLGFYAVVSGMLLLPATRRSSVDLADPLYKDATSPLTTVMSMAMGYQLTRGTALDLHVENVLDEAYRLHGAGYWGSGVNARVQLRLGF